jgi:hypothetical protein
MEVRRNTRNPPRVTAGLVEALGGERKSGGGSARRDSPACVFTRYSRLRNEGKRLWVRAQCKNKLNQGVCGIAGGLPRQTENLRGGRTPASGGPAATMA